MIFSEALYWHLILVLIFNLLQVSLGYSLIRNSQLLLSWTILIIGVLAIHLLLFHDPPVVRMFGLITTGLVGMKVIVATETYKKRDFQLSFLQWLFFAVGWVGMRVQPFEKLGQPALKGSWPKIRFGLWRILAGFSLIFIAHLLVNLPFRNGAWYMLITGILLIAFSLILHFGLLSISAGLWRLFGVDSYFLFIAPTKSKNLTAFWSRHWNIAFSEMTSIAVFKPLVSKVGNFCALIMAFLFSGLMHELAISIPVKTGYGGPLLYFLIQGLVVLLEKVLLKMNAEILKKPLVSKLWILFWLVLPLPLLFHREFITEIVWPLAGLDINYR